MLGIEEAESDLLGRGVKECFPSFSKSEGAYKMENSGKRSNTTMLLSLISLPIGHTQEMSGKQQKQIITFPFDLGAAQLPQVTTGIKNHVCYLVTPECDRMLVEWKGMLGTDV